MWIYKEKEFLSEHIGEYFGFVYIITNLSNSMKYIGKKQFKTHKWSQKKNKKTGRIKKTKIIIESDWKDYYGSNEMLNEEVNKIGSSNFKREILHLCKTKSEMSYLETKLQFQYDVLLKEDFYNYWISCKIRKSHLKSMNVL